MYQYKDIKSVHLELTTKCNAMCPQCARTINGGRLNPSLSLVELSLQDIKKIFEPVFLRQLKSIALCGNYGDPIIAKDLISICSYFKESNPLIELEMYTNGSARDKDTWVSLASILDRCIFAIDGLEDTNKVYRQRTNWNSIVENVRTFVHNGGVAEWHYLIFRHNEHQIAEASDLAKKLGFVAFRTKRTGRFIKNGKMLDYFPILDGSGIEIGKLEPPANLENINSTALLEDRTQDYLSMLQTADIHCLVAESKSIYISGEGYIFPCCWLGQLVPVNHMTKKKEQMLALIEENGGFDSISAKFRSVEDILDSKLFQQAIPSRWSAGKDRLLICANQCSAFCLTESQNDWHPVWLK